MDTPGEDIRTSFTGWQALEASATDGEESALPMRSDRPAQRLLARAHARKMEALGRLAGGVAHDFNNVLHVIRNALALLEQTRPPEEGQRYLEMIRRSTERGTALARQLLDCARPGALASAAFDPNPVVLAAADPLQSALAGRITVRTDLAPGVWPVAADAGELETALLNLGVNARDAIAGNGCVRLETANARLQAADSAGDRAGGEYVMIAVADSGCGMPQRIIERACEPFFTTKGPGAGTGLGLAQVATFVRNAGGRLEIASREARGTTVRIFLPKSNRASASG